MIIKVIYGQTLMDIAIQYYGDARALVTLAIDNDLAIDSDLFAGQELIINDSYPDTAIPVYANYIAESSIIVVSGQGGDTELIPVLATNDDKILTDNTNVIQI